MGGSIFEVRDDAIYNIFSQEPMSSIAILYDTETFTVLRVGTPEDINTALRAVQTQNLSFARTLGVHEIRADKDNPLYLETIQNVVDLVNKFWECTGSFELYIRKAVPELVGS